LGGTTESLVTLLGEGGADLLSLFRLFKFTLCSPT
jgi:hypothetical protein